MVFFPMNPTAPCPPADGSTAGGLPAVSPLRAVIAYDSPAAGLRGLRRLKSLLGESERERQLAVWPFAQLSSDEWRDTILGDLASADLLVLATRGPECWPETDDTWLRAALAERSGQTLTVISFPGTEEAWTLTLEGCPSLTPNIEAPTSGLTPARQAA
jgi:hypothetical protein